MKNKILKSSTDELMQATFVVLVPDEVDLHGDIVSEAEVRKACFNFNMHCQTPNLFHITKTKTFAFAESFCAPADMVVEGKAIVKGTWLATVQCFDPKLWELIKSGEVCGLSIGAMGFAEEIEDEDEDE